MITIGVDPHKHLHVALAVNEAGHEVAEWQGPNNPDGWTKLVAWSRSLGTERQMGDRRCLELCTWTRPEAGSVWRAVFDINPRWTAERRRGARNTSKTDKRDAKAIASVEHVLGTRPSIHPETIG